MDLIINQRTKKGLCSKLWSDLSKAVVAGLLMVGMLLPSGETFADTLDDLAPGSTYRIIFVTSTTKDATDTDIIDYDDFVEGVADSGTYTDPLAADWRVVGSTEDDDAEGHIGAANGFVPNDNAPIYNTNGDLVAVDSAALWDAQTESLEASINFDEDGETVGAIDVFSGTDHDGSIRIDNYLGNDTDPVTYGLSSATANWIRDSDDPVGSLKSFYGISNHLVKAEIPEPGTYLALGSMLLMVGMFRSRKGKLQAN